MITVKRRRCKADERSGRAVSKWGRRENSGKEQARGG
jgi:hypothetical protein